MVDESTYKISETAWCPGCGNFSIIGSVKNALIAAGLEPHEVLFVSGIGQAAKAPHYLGVNLFDGLHGRAIPVATGAKLVRPELNIIVESGDGCTYGEGGNHFISAIRRNIDITVIVHNNQVYGLTKGQASPTSDEGMVTKAQPDGVRAEPFNPVVIAVALKAGFVARSFSGMPEHATEMIVRGIRHKGFSLIDILQPCVTFNKVNNFAWYKKRCFEVGPSHDTKDWDAAVRLASMWGDKIPVGVIYENNREPYGGTKDISTPDHKSILKKIIDKYI